jgi:hypothetical protein
VALAIVDLVVEGRERRRAVMKWERKVRNQKNLSPEDAVNREIMAKSS